MEAELLPFYFSRSLRVQVNYQSDGGMLVAKKIKKTNHSSILEDGVSMNCNWFGRNTFSRPVQYFVKQPSYFISNAQITRY